MRRLYQILLGLFVVFLIFLVAYAIPGPTRDWIQTNLGPPLTSAFGGIATTITTNPIWTNYITPFPNQALILGALIWIPFFWLFLKARTKVRRTIFTGAAKDSGMYPTMTEPISTPSHSTTTAPAPQAETKPPVQPTPTPVTPPVEEPKK